MAVLRVVVSMPARRDEVKAQAKYGLALVVVARSTREIHSQARPSLDASTSSGGR